MNSMSEKVKVIPCSGIGKVHGLLAREMAYKLVNEVCPEISETKCLALIVTGDQEISDWVKAGSSVTLDGCPKMCAAKSVAHAGGSITEEFKVIDALKEYRGAKPGSPTALNEEGWKIVDETVEKLSARVREIYGEG